MVESAGVAFSGMHTRACVLPVVPLCTISNFVYRCSLQKRTCGISVSQVLLYCGAAQHGMQTSVLVLST